MGEDGDTILLFGLPPWFGFHEFLRFRLGYETEGGERERERARVSGFEGESPVRPRSRSGWGEGGDEP
jgi:hypothetical protein